MGVKLKYFTCRRQGFYEDGGGKKAPDGTSVKEIVTETILTDECVEGDKTQQKQKRERSSQRGGCLAHIKISIMLGGRYRVYEFVEEHNHVLGHPDYKRHLKASIKLNYSQMVKLHQMNQASIGPVKLHQMNQASIGSVIGHKILAKMSGGYDNVGASVAECENFKRDVNAFIGDADCQMVVNILTEKKDILPDFSIEYFTSDDGRLGGLFWADENAKRNYFVFGDVVALDATYRTNK